MLAAKCSVFEHLDVTLDSAKSLVAVSRVSETLVSGSLTSGKNSAGKYIAQREDVGWYMRLRRQMVLNGGVHEQIKVGTTRRGRRLDESSVEIVGVAADSSCETEVSLHDGYSPRVNGAQVPARATEHVNWK